MSIDKNISAALDIEPVESEVKLPTVQSNSNTAVSKETVEIVIYEDQEDFDLARNTIRDLIDKGVKKLDEYGSLASDLENARAFEVYANMLEKVSGLTKDLYDIHQKKKDLRETDVPNNVYNVDKAVFVGNQTEYLQFKKKQRNGNGQV